VRDGVRRLVSSAVVLARSIPARSVPVRSIPARSIPVRSVPVRGTVSALIGGNHLEALLAEARSDSRSCFGGARLDQDFDLYGSHRYLPA
jgi:hypothetical protein